MGGRAFLSGILLGLAAAVAVPAVALADARVTVRLTDHEGRPVDGTVTLTSRNVTRSCRTTAARCTITAPAGTYTVTLRPARGTAPDSRTLRVPASGTISLALRAGPPEVRTTAVGTPTSTRQARPARRTAPTATTTAPTGVTRAVRVPARRVTTQPRATRIRRATAVRTATAVRPTVSPAPPTGGSGSGSTSGGSDDGEATPSSTPTATGTVARRIAVTQETRDLSSGDELAVQGRVLDRLGRPTDATITVKRGDTVVGTVSTTAGSFSIYDLEEGTYDVSLRSSRGTTSTSRFTVGTGTSRVTLRVP